MKKIKTKLVALLLVMAVVLAGCATEEMSLKINSNGSGELIVNAVIDEDELMKNVEKVYKSIGISGAEMDMVRDEMKQSIAPMLKESGFKEVTLNGKKCYQMIHKESIAKGKLTKTVMGDGNGYVIADTFYMTFNINDMIFGAAGNSSEKIDKQEIEQAMQMIKASGIDLNKALIININVEFSKPIVSTNGNISSTNKNRASFSVTPSAAGTVTMFATTNPKVTLSSAAATNKSANTIKKPKFKKIKANRVSKKAKKASITIKFGKVKGAKKYQIQYSTKASFKKAKTKTIKKTTYKISKLKKNKKYYVRVRAVKYNMAGKEIYSTWIKKSVRTKK